MNLLTNNALKVYKKELFELLKDKRTRTSALLGPFLTIVMVLFLFGFLLDNVSKASSQKVFIVDDGSNNLLVTALKQAKTQILTLKSVDEGKKRITDGTARVVLRFVPDPKNAGRMTVEEYFDPNQEAATVTKTFVETSLNEINQKSQSEFLKVRGIGADEGKPFKLEEKKVSNGQASAGEILIGFLPYMIVIWAFYGGMGIVGEMVAGEKEKNTLETLLITPVSRRDIATGKLLALASICLASSLSTVVAVLFVGALNLPFTQTVFQKGLGVSPTGLAVIILVLIPTVLVFASALLAASARARNIREAYTQLTLLSFIVLMPALVSQFIGYTDFARARWVSLIPVLNSATAIRQALLGNIDPVALAFTVVSGFVIGFALLSYTISLFNKEEVLLRI
jgi:sodium transport system permease protein